RLHERARETAERQLAEIEQRSAQLAEVPGLWPALLELAERLEQLSERAKALLRRHESIPDAVAAIASRLLVTLEREQAETSRNLPLTTSSDSTFEIEILGGVREHRESAAQLDRAIADLTARLQVCREGLARLEAELNGLAPFAEAKAGGRWWTPLWWRATLRGDVAGRAADLQAQVQCGRQELAQIEEEAARLASARRQAEEKERAERAARIEREITRRREGIRDEESL